MSKIHNPVVLINKPENNAYVVAITDGSKDYRDARLMASMELDMAGDGADTWSRVGYYMAAEIEMLRQRIIELEEIATDYAMKFQRTQDALKYMGLSQCQAANLNSGITGAHSQKIYAAEFMGTTNEYHKNREEIIERIAVASQLRSRDGRRVVSEQIYEDVVKPMLDELETKDKRIAGLAARAVNLPKRSVVEVMHMSGFSRDYAEGWCSANDNAIHEIRAAGIGVRGGMR